MNTPAPELSPAERAEVERFGIHDEDVPPSVEPAGTCDWGDCNYLARFWRWSAETSEWLPVCFKHSEDGEQFYDGLYSTYQNTKGAFA